MGESKTSKNDKKSLGNLIAFNLSSSDKAEQFNKITMILARCLNMPIAFVSSNESKKQIITGAYGIDHDINKNALFFCDHTILKDEVLIIEDTHNDKRFKNDPMVVDGIKIRFYAGFPLTSLLGHNIGALCIADTIPRKLGRDDLNIFMMMGELLVERIRMQKLGSIQNQIQESKVRLELLNTELSKSNQFHRQLFGRYMSESLLNGLHKQDLPELGGEERYATIMISDLRDFSSMSEKYEAKVIVEILNLYFEVMIGIIHEHDGYINEILGDGILVVFGAPNKIENCAEKSIRCARSMQRSMPKINALLAEKNLPSLYMGIGINSGKLIVGNIGSQKRMKYGVVGETVNLASRIESLTVANQILVSESTFGHNTDWVKPIGQMKTKLKGFQHPIMVYDVSETNPS
ncbi:GAF domain-containing protein [Zobellia sp.]|nr:GAF domain-containing protein [Zobellia sp.]